MQGKANFRGHPLHLILVSFPVAFWTGAVFTDTVGALGHDPFWFRMSVVLVAMGTVVALPAALCGYIDYRTVRMTRKARSVATGHLIWSLASIAIFALAYAARANAANSVLGIALTATGTVVFLVGGYLGSELANRFRVGIIERAAPGVTRSPP